MKSSSARAKKGCICTWIVIVGCAGAMGCGGGSTASSTSPPPPPAPPVSLSVSPASASVALGATQQFRATVSNTGNTAVAWAVNGVPGGNSAVGTILTDGMYTAPQAIPAQNAIAVQATSQADTSKSATATVNIVSDVTVSVTPGAADVELGATRQFVVTVSGSGNPSRAVNWSVTGPACSEAACGGVDANGLYAAPQIRPVSPAVVLSARSAADPAKSASATINVSSSFSLSVSGPATVNTGAAAQYTATLSPAPNSNPSTAVSWSVSGLGCSGTTCGSITGTGLYTSPLSVPSPNTVMVTATPAADAAKAASLLVTITTSAAISVRVAPTVSMRAVNHKQTFAVQVIDSSDANVEWKVNDIAGGNVTVGRICVANSDPCQSISTTSASAVDYLAPAAVPARNPVTVSATSQIDPASSGSATVTVLAHIQVSVSPPNATLAVHRTQQFAASVAGTSDQNVIWQISGSGCAGAGSPCGSIDASGFYIAPLAPPSPNTLTVTATSSEDTSRSATATVTIATGSTVTALLPASVTAGAVGGFTLRVQASSFVASSPGPGSTILFNNSAKPTACADTTECTTTLVTADLSVAGSFPVQIRNPDATVSNQVFFVVVAPGVNDDVIALTPAAPTVTGKDIVVVEPTTAGTSSDLNLNVTAIGIFSTAANTCVLGNSPIVLKRPASGATNVEICAFSLSGLDPALSYSITGPTANDIAVIAKQPLGLGIIHLTLQVSSSTRPGVRTLFVENGNKDKTAATGALEVK